MIQFDVCNESDLLKKAVFCGFVGVSLQIADVGKNVSADVWEIFQRHFSTEVFMTANKMKRCFYGSIEN